jgi:DNA-binding SARP family transcriptional activator/predicted Zn-dependent protease
MCVIRLRLLGGVELSAHENGRAHRLSLPPKPLALLGYLAVASAETIPVRRDPLLALFWPELSSDKARGALRQLLFQLRRVVGADVLRTDRENIALVPEALSCDVVDFGQQLAAGDRIGAMELYRGALLEGFFFDGVSAALEEWIEGARMRLNGRAFSACCALADEAERARNGVAAARWAREAVALAPDNETAVRRLIQILDTFGDRCGALRAAEDFARRLAEEFDAAPSAETQALIAAVRRRSVATGNGVASIPVHAVHSPAAVESSGQARPISAGSLARSRSTRNPAFSWRPSVLAAALATIGIAGALFVTGRGSATPGPRRSSRAESPPITVASRVRGLYEEGLDRYYAGDPRESARLLTAAFARDSGCAMCAYYAAIAEASFNEIASDRLLQSAVRLANRVSEPERLLIKYRWADARNSFERRAAGDSLVVKYPDWPEAQTAAAEADNMDGAWLTAADHLRRAIAGEPIPDTATGPDCPACATRFLLIDTYRAADSLAAAARVAQQLIRVQPHSRIAWRELSHVLAESGRFDEARAAIDSSTKYASGTDEDVIEHALIEIRARQFAKADQMLTALAQTGNANSRSDALWFEVISLRAQGRLREARGIAEGPLRKADASSTHGIGISTVADAQVLFELGAYRRAAAIFTANAAEIPDPLIRGAQGRVARQHAWMLTQAGSALAAAGDTLALAALVDTVQAWGELSGFGRDRRLPDYLRGLLWMARARPDSAVSAFSRATFSETEGFSRNDLERARALLALGRPREAIPVLRHPLEGGLEAGNFYVPRTELQEMLARAYEAAGERDSAAVYYRYVVEAWRNADAQFEPRVVHARERLALDDRRLLARR